MKKWIKYLGQLLLILAISFLGELLHKFIPAPIPASIYGILILFLSLLTGIIPLAAVRDAGKFLIRLMPVMFVPAAVGLIDTWDAVRSAWMAYVFITVVSTYVVMLVAGHVTQFMVERKGGKNND